MCVGDWPRTQKSTLGENPVRRRWESLKEFAIFHPGAGGSSGRHKTMRASLNDREIEYLRSEGGDERGGGGGRGEI